MGYQDKKVVRVFVSGNQGPSETTLSKPCKYGTASRWVGKYVGKWQGFEKKKDRVYSSGLMGAPLLVRG